MMIMTSAETVDKKQNVLSLLSLLLPDYKISITPQSLLFAKDNDMIMVDENNFEALQSVLKSIFCLNSSKAKEEQFNPANKKAKEIADKIAAGRKRSRI